jgi:multiple sugar transport system substrate-binding protein
MRKRWLGLLMVITLGLGVITGCGNGITSDKEEIKLIVKCPTLIVNSISNPDIEDSETFLEMAAEAFSKQYEDANVSIDVKVFEYVDETEAITESFDTDSAADVLYEDYFNMTSYIHTGRVVPLDDMITDEIRDDIDDTTWEISSTDGKTYMMPYLSRQNIMIYNKKLMKDCGLDQYISDDTTIQNWTTDQWTEILDTLAEKLPEGVYPMMMYAKNNQGDTNIMSMLHAFGSTIFNDSGEFNFEDEKAVEALSWIQDGVKKGWYPPHAENLEIIDTQELFGNNQLAFYVYNNGAGSLYDNLDDYGFVNFPGNVATSFVTGFEVFDNGDDSKVKVAKDFIKYIYETEDLLEISAGSIPASKSVAEKYADQITMLSDFTANASHVIDFMNGSPNWQGTDTSVRSVFWPNIHKLLLGTMTPQECAKSLDEDCNNALKIGWENSTLHE